MSTVLRQFRTFLGENPTLEDALLEMLVPVAYTINTLINQPDSSNLGRREAIKAYSRFESTLMPLLKYGIGLFFDENSGVDEKEEFLQKLYDEHYTALMIPFAEKEFHINKANFRMHYSFLPILGKVNLASLVPFLTSKVDVFTPMGMAVLHGAYLTSFLRSNDVGADKKERSGMRRYSEARVYPFDESLLNGSDTAVVIDQSTEDGETCLKMDDLLKTCGYQRRIFTAASCYPVRSLKIHLEQRGFRCLVEREDYPIFEATNSMD